MKKILCYGDSNTFGFNPKDGSRFDENTRWSGILGKNLRNEYYVVEEGLNNRTGFVNNPDGFSYSGNVHFSEFLLKQDNFDIIILALGTNDLQFQYEISRNTIKKGLENLIKIAKTKSDKIIIIPPTELKENILKGYFKIQFNEESIQKSKQTGAIYRELALNFNCNFFDINKIVKPSGTDGLHYEVSAHKIIAEKLTEFIKKELNNET